MFCKSCICLREGFKYYFAEFCRRWGVTPPPLQKKDSRHLRLKRPEPHHPCKVSFAQKISWWFGGVTPFFRKNCKFLPKVRAYNWVFFLSLKVFSMWCSVQRGSVPLSRRWVAVSHHRRQISPWFAWFTTQRWEIAAVDEEEVVPSLCSLCGNYGTFRSGFSTQKIFICGSPLIQRIQVECFICLQLYHKGTNLI